MADIENCSSGSDTLSSCSFTAKLSWPIPPWSLEEARERSRAGFPDNVTGNSSRLTFSSMIKRVFDQPGEDGRGTTKDFHLVEFLCGVTSRSRRGTRGEVEFDALRFYVPSTTEGPKSYDETHFRKAFSHDIAFAVEKQNKVAAAIRECGFVIDYSVVDAHLLVIFGHLMSSNAQTQYFHWSGQTLPREGGNGSEEALPGYEATREVCQERYLVRRVGDVAVIQAWESLTKERCMQWLAHKPNDATPYWFSAFINDKVSASGALSFDMELVYQKLPVHSVPLNVFCHEHRDEAEQGSEVEEHMKMSKHEWVTKENRRVWFTMAKSDVVIDIKEL